MAPCIRYALALTLVCATSALALTDQEKEAVEAVIQAAKQLRKEYLQDDPERERPGMDEFLAALTSGIEEGEAMLRGDANPSLANSGSTRSITAIEEEVGQLTLEYSLGVSALIDQGIQPDASTVQTYQSRISELESEITSLEEATLPRLLEARIVSKLRVLRQYIDRCATPDDLVGFGDALHQVFPSAWDSMLAMGSLPMDRIGVETCIASTAALTFTVANEWEGFGPEEKTKYGRAVIAANAALQERVVNVMVATPWPTWEAVMNGIPAQAQRFERELDAKEAHQE